MMPVGCVCEGATVSEQRKVVGEPSDPTALVVTRQIQIMFVVLNNTTIVTFIGFVI